MCYLAYLLPFLLLNLACPEIESSFSNCEKSSVIYERGKLIALYLELPHEHFKIRGKKIDNSWTSKKKKKKIWKFKKDK